MKKILIISNIPAPYFIDYLDELSKYFEITALFELKKASDRVDAWYKEEKKENLHIVFLNALKFNDESGLSFKVIKYLSNKKYDRIIIANPTTLTGIIELLYCRFFKVHHIIQSEGGFQGIGTGLKENFKRFLMEKADIYLSGMGGYNDYFLKYGGTKNTIKRYPFSSLKSSQLCSVKITKDLKDNIRKEYNMCEEKIVLSVGRFIPQKGYDILLEAFSKFDYKYGLYLIGGIPPEEYIDKIKKYNMKNVHFIDFCDYKKLQKYYLSADVFVLPTRGDTWGLVINEAMSNGLPVITTDKCIAGLELIVNDQNGYIIPVDDVEELYKQMFKLLNNEALRKSMSEKNLIKMKDYTIENMSNVIKNHLLDLDGEVIE